MIWALGTLVKDAALCGHLVAHIYRRCMALQGSKMQTVPREKVFIIFVCYEDGFTCLSWPELKKLLDDNLEDGEWVHIKRMRKEKYTVTGSDGKLKYKIGKNEFPEKITKNL